MLLYRNASNIEISTIQPISLRLTPPACIKESSPTGTSTLSSLNTSTPNFDFLSSFQLLPFTYAQITIYSYYKDIFTMSFKENHKSIALDASTDHKIDMLTLSIAVLHFWIRWSGSSVVLFDLITILLLLSSVTLHGRIAKTTSLSD